VPKRSLLIGLAAALAVLALAGGAAAAVAAAGGRGDPVDPGAAKISPTDAAKAATTAVPGRATDVQLENEDGRALYEVTVQADSGRKTEVHVNAANGTVLTGDGDDGDDGDRDGDGD
jgi:uncharacterized membrane protein YkoI